MKHSKPSEPKLVHKLKFDAIGTTWVIDSSTGLTGDHIAQIHQRIDEYDKAYSRFRKDSLITSMSQAAGAYTLPTDAKPLFDLYQKLYSLTDGYFTPLIGQTLSDAGYDANYRLMAKHTIAKPPKWESVLEYNFPSLTISEPVLLDVGAGGKGYLADIVGSLLGGDFTINAGGDIVHHSDSNKTLSVALEDPDDPTQAIGVAHLGNGSLCGSAGNRRTWGEYHHIINPKTLVSPSDIAAVWVIAETGLLADSLSTALFFTEPSVLQKVFTFEYATLHKDRSLHYSKNFPGEFFS